MPQGDTQLLMAKIQAIEAFPDNKAHSVKPINLRDDDKIIRKSCTACKFRGHSVTECWGKCQHCGKYGHKSNLCRHKPDLTESEPAKKASVDGKSKPKGKKKKGRKEKAKKVAELVEALSLHTPVNSSDDETSSSDGDNSPQSQAVRRVQEYQTSLSRREARANDNASLISDQKVIDTLNRTHLASKVKRHY